MKRIKPYVKNNIKPYVKQKARRTVTLIKVKKTELAIFFISLAIMITLVSMTIGRDLLSGQDPTLLSYALIHFGGYLFFLLMPVEALIPVYVAQGHNVLFLFVISIITAIAGQIIDYSIGYLISEKFIVRVVKKKRIDKAETVLTKWGDPIIFLFNATPISSPIILLVAGMLRYNPKRTAFFTIAGLLTKYTVIFGVVLLFF